MINTTDRPSAQSEEEQEEENGINKAAGGKFLTFILAGEEYGIEILSVHEIIGMMPITSVPGTPDYICGIINLRGKVIPIVDIRKKFGMDSKGYDEETCIIVVSVHEVVAGVVVDQVSEVIDIPNEDIETSPSFGKGINMDFILGIGKSQSRIKILLNIDRIISTDQIVNLHKTVNPGTPQTEELPIVTAV